MNIGGRKPRGIGGRPGCRPNRPRAFAQKRTHRDHALRECLRRRRDRELVRGEAAEDLREGRPVVANGAVAPIGDGGLCLLARTRVEPWR